jgi:POT family proton-dependent oligopeptide transporter
MWECFSYYGMRAILVLYMLDQLGYSDMRAFGVLAIYASLTEAGGMIGGYLADKMLGLKYAIYLGACTIAAGHLSMAIPGSIITFYLGLGLIIVGTSLFRTNCTALLGEFYSHNDRRRDAGFTTFYVGINIGYLIATIACAYTAEVFGWHYAFSLATIGMFIGIMILLRFDFLLESKGKRPKGGKVLMPSILCIAAAPICAMMVFYQEIFINIIPLVGAICLAYVFSKVRKCTSVERHNVYIILCAIVMLIIFFACEEQLGSTLILFAERNVATVIFGYNVPAPSLTTIAPLTIILFGSLLSKLISAREKKSKSLNPFNKMNFGLFLLSLSFVVLYVGCQFADHDNFVHVNYVVVSFAIMAFAEIIIAPTVDSLCTNLAPRHLRGMMMGVVYMGYSFANLSSGYLSQVMAVNPGGNEAESLSIYEQGFMEIAIGCLSATAIIAIMIMVRRKFYRKLEIK